MTTEIKTTWITLTEAAAAHIRAKINEKEAATAFRLSVKTTGCNGYQYCPELVEQAQPDDIAFVLPQEIQIYIAADSAGMIKGTVIDYLAKGFGLQQLEFNNPNADSLCGCGESFNLKEEDKDD